MASSALAAPTTPVARARAAAQGEDELRIFFPFVAHEAHKGERVGGRARKDDVLPCPARAEQDESPMPQEGSSFCSLEPVDPLVPDGALSRADLRREATARRSAPSPRSKSFAVP